MKKKILSVLLAASLMAGVGSTQSGFANFGSLEVNAAEVAAEETWEITKPYIEEDASMGAGQRVTWDTIYYGYYPQTEIVADKKQCGAAKGQAWSKDEDYEVDAELYEKLQNASYTKNEDTVIDGVKYRRLKKENCTNPVTAVQDIFHYYFWAKSVECHYFRYEPIRWRVLDTSGQKALLLADVTLDDQVYHKSEEDITWENSYIRSWLNGYGEENNCNFIDAAFREKEQNALVATSLQNLQNLNVNNTSGGADTQDKVFVLSEMETYAGDNARRYGFVSYYKDGDPNARDEARRSKSTTFAKAMGIWSNYEDGFIGNCLWWMRSPGRFQNYAAFVCNYGFIRNNGAIVNKKDIGVRPSLIIDLTDSSIWSYGGTVCSNGTDNKTDAPARNVFADQKMDDEDKDNAKKDPKPEKILVTSVKVSSTLSTKIATGKSVQLKATVVPSEASNKSLAWKTSNKKYATVNRKGLVKMLPAGKGKTITVSATAKDGSKKKGTIKLSIVKDRVKSISAKGPKTLERGKNAKVQVKVKTTGKTANKTLRYTSSNPKYIKVSTSGKVTVLKKAKKGASVKITVASLDGTNRKTSVKIKIK